MRDYGARENGGSMYVETSEMEELQNRRVGDKRLEVGGRCLTFFDLDEMRVAVAARELHEAETVASGDQAHGFAVDGD